MTIDLEPARRRLGDLGDRRDAAVDGERRARSPRRRAGRASRSRRRSPRRSGSAGASRPRRRARAGAAPRASSPRCRRRRSRRGRRCAAPRRLPRGSARTRRACRRGGTGRAAAARPSRNARAASGSVNPRRTRTLAVSSLIPSASASSRPPHAGTDGVSRCPRASFHHGTGSVGRHTRSVKRALPPRPRRRLSEPRLVRRLPAPGLRALPGVAAGARARAGRLPREPARRPPRRRARRARAATSARVPAT